MSHQNRPVARQANERTRRLRSACAAAAPAFRPFEQLENRVLMSVAAHYYNDGFWGRGNGDAGRPPAPSVTRPFPDQAISVTRAGDVVTSVNQIAFDWGTGSPHPAIRGDDHSTVFVGKIVIPTAGDYEILGYGDDDTHVFVGGKLVSSNPGGHGIEDPRSPASLGRGGGSTIETLAAGAHDLIVVQAEQGGGSGVFLRWITPAMVLAGEFEPVNVPAANLTADNAIPDAPTNFQRTLNDVDGNPLPATEIAFTFTDNSTEELRYELERSTDGVNFTALPRSAHINAGRISDFGAAQGVNYTYRLVAVNFAGRSTPSATATATGAQTLPAAPTGLSFTPGAFSGELLFTDNATNETGFQIYRNTTNSITGATLAGTAPADASNFIVNGLLPGQTYFFFVRAVNDVGPGTAASVSGTTTAGTRPVPAGPGAYAEFFNVSNDQPNIFAEPAFTRVDPMINFDFGAGSPDASVNVDNHSARWTGRIGVPADFDGDGVTGETLAVRFVSATDDGAFMWINGETVIFDQTYHGIFNRLADRTVNLTEGQAYPFQYQFFEGGGGSGAFLRVVNPPTGAIVDVPAAAFVSSQRGPVPAPSNLRGTNVDAFQATVVFDNENSTAQNYFINVSDGAGNSRDFVTTPDGSPFTVTGLTPNTTYTVRVRGYNIEGGISPESTATFTTLGTATAPAAPSVVRVLARAGATQVVITDNSFNETGFAFERSVNGGAFTDAGTVGASAPGTSGGTVSFTDTATVAGQSVVYRIRATGIAAPAGAGDSTTVTTTAVTLPVPGTGVRKRAFDDIDFTGNDTVPDPVVENPVPDIEEDYGEGAPAAGLGVDQFSVIFDGYFLAEYTGTYHFGISTDDGAAFLLIDPATGQPLINHNNLGARRGGDFGNPQDRLAPVNLVAGTKYPIEARMVEDGGGANIKLFLSIDGGASYQSVPTAVLFPVTGTETPSLPPTIQSANSFGTERINLNFSDFNFTETGFQIERSPTGAEGSFTPAGTAPADAGTFTLAGPFTAGTPIFFRIRATGAGGTFSPYSNVVSVTPSNPATETRTDLTLNGTAQFITVDPLLDGDGEALRLTDNVNAQTGTAYLTHARNVDRDGVINFKFQIPEGNGADGFAFVMQSNAPTAVGGGGGALGFEGVPNSLGIKFDIYDNINQTGVFLNGGSTQGGVDLGFEIDNAHVYDVTLTFDVDGADTDGDGLPDPGTDNDAVTVRIADLTDPLVTPFEQKLSLTADGIGGTPFDIDTVLGSDNAFIGFAGATGGLNAEQIILDFNVYGQEIPLKSGSDPIVAEVYALGSLWNADFKAFLQSSGVGNATYGYPLPESPTNQQTVSWINTNQIVLRYASDVTGAGVPTPGGITLDGTRQDYTVTAVTALDARTYVLTLDRALGNIPGGGVDGDKVRLTVPGGGVGTASFSRVINVLQGDASRDALGRVNAADQGYVKSRLNRTALVPNGPVGSASYTVFADVDASGRVNAADQGAVKSRLNDGMPATAPAASLFSGKRIAEEVLA